MAGQPNPQSGVVEFTLGNDHAAYVKADGANICRVSRNFALSFYQMDYQALANILTGQSSEKPGAQHLLLVSRVVFDEDAFRQFKNEFEGFLKKLADEGWS